MDPVRIGITRDNSNNCSCPPRMDLILNTEFPNLFEMRSILTLVSYDAHLIGLKFTLPYNYAYAITHICPSISP